MTVARYLFAGAIWTRNLATLAALILVAGFVGWFLGQTTVIERDQASLALSTEFMRLLTVLGVPLLLSHFLHKIQISKEIQTLLALPYTRLQFLIQMIIAACAGIFLLLLCHSLFIAFFFQAAQTSWIPSLFLESFCCLGLILFFSFSLNSALKTDVLLITFYFLGRVKGALLATLTSPFQGIHEIWQSITKALFWLLPSFDLFLQNPSGILSGSLIVDALLTSLFFLSLTLIGLLRKCW